MARLSAPDCTGPISPNVMKTSLIPALILAAVSFTPALRAAHEVSFEKELFITAPEVLDSPEAGPGGAWHIRSALGRIAGKGADVDAYAAAWFASWADNESLAGVNDTFARRPWVTAALSEAWKGNRIHLIAIVNRIDLARFPGGNTAKAPLTLGFPSPLSSNMAFPSTVRAIPRWRSGSGPSAGMRLEGPDSFPARPNTGRNW
jgi:hypothetical protein